MISGLEGMGGSHVSRDIKLDREIPTPGLIASRHWYSQGPQPLRVARRAST
jgi:hypothetical protein